MDIIIYVIIIFIIAYIYFGGKTSVGNLSYKDLLRLATNAGFEGTDAQIAAGIALAESSGNPDAYNPETEANTPEGKGSYGLWQIYLKAHPEFSGLNLYNPQQNANAAFLIFSKAGDFSPWSTFKSGRYLSYL